MGKNTKTDNKESSKKHHHSKKKRKSHNPFKKIKDFLHKKDSDENITTPQAPSSQPPKTSPHRIEDIKEPSPHNTTSNPVPTKASASKASTDKINKVEPTAYTEKKPQTSLPTVVNTELDQQESASEKKMEHQEDWQALLNTPHSPETQEVEEKSEASPTASTPTNLSATPANKTGSINKWLQKYIPGWRLAYNSLLKPMVAYNNQAADGMVERLSHLLPTSRKETTSQTQNMPSSFHTLYTNNQPEPNTDTTKAQVTVDAGNQVPSRLSI